ncbi:Zinc finger, PHD-type [Gossypium australe]|uniref:Zinc finger, PHD-type n=1 Tax=Gossypium australe TaxID=47621 RepID=A0A5B6V283_9ROSI|nr:Zinc finger, PHD-type [Gossypium australe]
MKFYYRLKKGAEKTLQKGEDIYKRKAKERKRGLFGVGIIGLGIFSADVSSVVIGSLCSEGLPDEADCSAALNMSRRNRIKQITWRHYIVLRSLSLGLCSKKEHSNSDTLITSMNLVDLMSSFLSFICDAWAL